MADNRQLIEWAIKGLELERQEIDAELASLRKSLGTRAAVKVTAAAASPAVRRRRRLGAAGRKKISEAKKAWWAKQKLALAGRKKKAK